MSHKFEWHELIDRHLHGELNEAEKERLAEWLDSDPAARKAFVEQVQWDTEFSEALHERSGSLRDPITKQITDLISMEKTTIRRERRLKRILTRDLLTAAGLVAAFLISFSLLIALIRSQKEVTSLKHELELAKHDVAPVETNDSAVIQFYAREHQDLVARHASLSPAPPEPMQIQVSQDDILYYELLDGQPETMYPGIIVRGPLSQGQISPPKAPIISNGHTLSLSEAKETANFNLVAPLRLHPGFELDQIRRIDGRDALQLLYTNAIKSVSLFEQPLDGQRGLEPRDFREYAVYRNIEQAATTILAWKDHELSYVLIGNADMSQLMDMAQSISAAK
jgi:anti-sigma factor RsiW